MHPSSLSRPSARRARLTPLAVAVAALLISPAPALAQLVAGTEPGQATLPAIKVKAGAIADADAPPPHAGGQVARGARVGLLGNRDNLDTPFSVTSYTAELIENQQARSVGDVLANDPSVRFTTSGGHMYENFRLRGFDINSQELALNGMFGLIPYGHVPVEFVERVEVLKGPTALFTGMAPGGAVGGVVNLVPKRAADAPLSRVGVDYATGGQLGTHVDLGRRYGDDGEIGVRVNGSHREGGTQLDGQSKGRDFWSVAADYRGASLKASLDAYYSEESYSGGTPAMFSFSTTTIPSPPDASINQFRGLRGKLASKGAVLRGEYGFGADLSAYAGIGLLRHDYAGFINGTHARNVNATGQYAAWTTSQRGYDDALSAEAGLRASLRTGAVVHRLVLGLTSLDTESGSARLAGSTYRSDIYSPVTPILAADPGPARKSAEAGLTSLALADTLSFADDSVQLTLGLREQGVKSKSFSTTGAQTANYDKRALTPAAGLVFKPWGPSAALYANYVEGLSQGSTVTDTAADNYQQQFSPFKTRQFELGGKWDSQGFGNTLALFQIEKPSLIKTGNHYSDDGEQRNRGVEWTTYGSLLPTLRLLGGASFTRGELTSTAGGSTNGKTAIGTPRVQANLGSEWDQPWLAGFTLNARVTYTSSQYLNSANTQQVPGWIVLDLGARYATRLFGHRTVLRGNVFNVANRKYWSGSFSESFATLGAARNASVSATVDF